jgi:hypothetical protein
VSTFRFIHTSDLHLGRRFGNLPEEVRGRLVEARHGAIRRLAEAAREHGAGHVLVAGDLFDSETPSDRIWRQALDEMGKADAAWWIIPGNHDSLAAEALWERFAAQAPANVRLLDRAAPVEIAPGVSLLPAPATHRFPGRDLTEWMAGAATPGARLRIGLAHGGVVNFGAEDEGAATIPPDRAATAGLDYLALGDWHGMLGIGPRTFYPGTPERDRFKHAGRGACLAVTLRPGATPETAMVGTGQFDWRDIALRLSPGEDAAAALTRVLPDSGRRDMLVRLRPQGWVHLPQRMALAEAVSKAAPEFCHFVCDESELATEYQAGDLDDIDRGGALRLAAEALQAEATGAATEGERRVAGAALNRLYGYVNRSGA